MDSTRELQHFLLTKVATIGSVHFRNGSQEDERCDSLTKFYKSKRVIPIPQLEASRSAEMKIALLLGTCIALLSLSFARQRRPKVGSIESQREGKCKS